jgi:hypothetical protein
LAAAARRRSSSFTPAERPGNSRNSQFQKTYFTIHKIIKIVNKLDDFTIKEPYEAAIPGVFHGALYEKARVPP